MSEVSTPQQAEKIIHHPLETVLKDLEYLVKSLEMELDVAPSDRKAHQDLLHRIHRVSLSALQTPDEAWPLSVPSPKKEPQELTKEEQEMLENGVFLTEGEIGEEINVDAINKRLKERGYQIELSFSETPEG
ncbi:hypothetical protein [Argonema galeatum]|uniref:hypothetical protein n=1 Tax=Argonema galeatum TaxID=2942762 RepID=UPI002011CED1|nr:hypothetical protein [Argonema galeatum]MCL1468904.1 hypothetical protein [Argonema galeatum A003/A1]